MSQDPRPTAALRALQPDWDSYGARPLCPTACDRADEIVAVLRSLGLQPTVSPTVRGGVDVEVDGPTYGVLVECKAVPR